MTRAVFYAYVSEAGSVRITMRPLAPKANEIRVKVAIELPGVLYRRPQPEVRITVPEAMVPEPIEVVAEALGAARLEVVHVETDPEA